MDAAVAKTCRAEPVDVGCRHGCGIPGQRDRIVQQCPLARRDVDTCGTRLESCQQIVILGDLTESLPVMTDSVVAVVHHGDGDGDHLTLATGQLGAAELDLAV